MTRKPLLRPTLLPGLAKVWRDTGTLQIGLDPARAVLLDLPYRACARVLDLLTGDHPERVILTRAGRAGVAIEDARAVLDLLHAAGLVVAGHTLLPAHLSERVRQRLSGEAVTLALRAAGNGGPNPAHLLRRRAAARVVVSGTGRLTAPIAVGLAQAGVGHIHADVPGRVTAAELPGGPFTETDVGRPRRAAIADAIARSAPATATHPIRRGNATLVLQFGHDQPVALLSTAHRLRRQAHLAVAVREATAVVGPLVPAGGTPCLNCLDLHKQDRDPAWPRLCAQLTAEAPEPCAVSTVLLATGYAVAQALAYLDGGTPETVAAAVEITAAGRFRRRAWPPHPACDCDNRRPARPPAAAHGHRVRGTGRSVRGQSQ